MAIVLNRNGILLLGFLYIDTMIINDILVFYLDFRLIFGNCNVFQYLVSLRYPITKDKPN